MALSVAKLRGEVMIDTSQAETGLKKLSSNLKEFANQGQAAGSSVGAVFGGVLGANLFMGLAEQVRNAGTAALDAYSSYERLGFSLTALQAREILNAGGAASMGQAMAQAAQPAQDLLNWIQKLAIESPFTNEGIAQSFQLAQSFGFTTQEAKRLTQAMVDYSSATGKTSEVTNRMMLSLGQIQAQGKLTGMEIRELAMAGLPVVQILAKAFGKTTVEIKQMVTDGVLPADKAIQALVTSIENDFGGSAARMTNTFSGLLSSLEDIRQVNLRDLFGGMFESARPYLIEFVDAFKPGGPLNQGVKEWGQALGQVAGESMKSLKGITEQVTPLIGALASVPPSVYQLAAAFAAVTYVTPSAINGVGSLLGVLAGGLTPVGAFAIGIGTVATALVGYKLAVDAATQKTREFAAINLPAQLDQIAASGGGATRQIMAFASALDETKKGLMNGDFWTRAFADTTAVQTQMFGELSGSLSKTSGSYADYLAAMQEAAKGQQMYMDGTGQLYQVHQITADSNYKVALSYKALSEAEYAALKNQSLLKLTGTAAMDAGAGMIAATPAVNKFKDAMAELTPPTAATASQEKKAAEQAAQMALEMGKAKQAAFSLAEQLKGGGQKDIAKTFIDNLINSPAFQQLPNATAIINQLGLNFGLVTEKSIATANAMPILNNAMTNGQISVKDYGKAIELLNTQGGKFDITAFIYKFRDALTKTVDPAAMNTVMQGLGPSVSNAIGLNVGAGVDAAQPGINEKMTASATEGANSFSNGFLSGTQKAKDTIQNELAGPLKDAFDGMIGSVKQLIEVYFPNLITAVARATSIVAGLRTEIAGLTGKTITITIITERINIGGRSSGYAPGDAYNGTYYNPYYKYTETDWTPSANGLDMMVPPGYPNDSYYMPLRVQSGERVTVTPAGEWEQTTSRPVNITINMNVAKIDSRMDLEKTAAEMADIIRRKRL